MGISQKIKGKLSDQIPQLKNQMLELEVDYQLGDMGIIAKSFWDAGIHVGMILKWIGINIAYKVDSQIGFVCIADKVKSQVVGFLGVGNDVESQLQLTGIQLNNKGYEQLMLLPGIQIGGKITKQTQAFGGIQWGDYIREQLQGAGVQLAGEIEKNQDQGVGLQDTFKMNGEQYQWIGNTALINWVKEKIGKTTS